MKLDIIGRGVEITEALSLHVERRLHFALGRFGLRVPHVSVTIADLNGPRGGVDQLCRIIADITPRGKVVVEARDTDAVIAVARATERLGRAVGNELGRRRELAIRQPEISRLPSSALFRRQSRVQQEEEGGGR
jgi:ribosome-associated translation inhibitor RaiA